MATNFRNRRGAPLLICGFAYALAVGVAYIVYMALPGEPPLWVAGVATTAATLVIFAVSRLFGNSSIYDPYWSLQPIVLGGYWAATALFAGIGERYVIALGLVTLWGLRLTWNGLARFPTLEYEDPRYLDMKAQFGKLYPLVDLFGIQLFPTALVFAGSLPLFYVLSTQATPLGWLDAIAAMIMLGAILLEWIADVQLTRFRRTNTDPEKVCTVGLWGRSRHPNYFGEISFWWGLFLFALAVDASLWWTGAGAVAITLLFALFSIPDMQKRKKAKRPDYEEQVAGIPVIVPSLVSRK